MSGIFISYRRIDSRDYAGRLFDRLARYFGPSAVFMDVEGGIARGTDFVSTLERAVATVDAMVVVIGHEWSTCANDQGVRRLDCDEDWVRQEIASALHRDILVLPVLVGGASMPRAENLPENIRGLARKQAAEISDSRWDYDTSEIFRTLEHVVKPGSDAQRSSSAGKVLRKAARWFLWSLAGVAALIVAVYTYAFLSEPKASDYGISVEPPQIRISHSRANNDPQEIEITLTNTGRKSSELMIYEPDFSAQLSPGVFSVDLGTCKDRKIDVGGMCTAKLLFKPEWFNAEEREHNLEGRVSAYAERQFAWHPIPITVSWVP
jgi:hypothetical protein